MEEVGAGHSRVHEKPLLVSLADCFSNRAVCCLDSSAVWACANFWARVCTYLYTQLRSDFRMLENYLCLLLVPPPLFSPLMCCCPAAKQNYTIPTQLDTDMKVFIERTVSAWKFDATVDTDACQGDAAPATANPPGIRP